MRCIACASDAIDGMRACVECLQKSNLECIESYKKCMECLNNNIKYCETQKEYDDNRKSYERYRLEILYTTGEIPKPKNKKKTR